MKHFLFAILFIGNTAIACPNLSGSYACDSSDMEITQSLKSGHTEYTVYFMNKEHTYVSDGKPRVYTEKTNSGRTVIVETSRCNADTFDIRKDSKDYDNDGNLTASASILLSTWIEGFEIITVGSRILEDGELLEVFRSTCIDKEY